jgi:hypothetical protein
MQIHTQKHQLIAKAWRKQIAGGQWHGFCAQTETVPSKLGHPSLRFFQLVES